MEIHESIYILLMLLAYVIRRAGTFTLDEKIKMINFIGDVFKNSNVCYSSCCESRKCDHSTTPYITHSE
jgi:hypothetical protein